MKQNLQLTVSLFVAVSPLLLADAPPAIPGDVPFSYHKVDPAAHRVCQNDFSISKNGKLAVSGGEHARNGNAASGWAVWDLKTAKRVCKAKTTSFILHCIAISEDGNLVAVGGDRCIPENTPEDEQAQWPVELRIFNVASGKLLKALGGHGGLSMRKLAFTRDGKHLVSMSDDDVLRVWTVPKGEAVLKVYFTSQDPDRNEWRDLIGEFKSPKAALNVVHEKQLTRQ